MTQLSLFADHGAPDAIDAPAVTHQLPVGYDGIVTATTDRTILRLDGSRVELQVRLVIRALRSFRGERFSVVAGEARATRYPMGYEAQSPHLQAVLSRDQIEWGGAVVPPEYYEITYCGQDDAIADVAAGKPCPRTGRRECKGCDLLRKDGWCQWTIDEDDAADSFVEHVLAEAAEVPA